MAPNVPNSLWVEWALIVQAAEHNVQEWFQFKAYRDAQFQKLLNSGR